MVAAALLAAGLLAARAETHSASLQLAVTVTATTYANRWNMDQDGDGVPDWWEIDRFGSTFVADGTSDQDRDGASDRSEYIAGTDPRDPASLLVVADLDLLPNGDVVIAWDSTTVTEPGPRLYEVVRGDALHGLLTTNHVVMRQDIPSGGAQTAITNYVPPAARQYFGVNVRIQEP